MTDGFESGEGERHPDAVEAVLADVLLAPSADRAGALEQACREHPELEPELRARFRRLAEFGWLDEPSAADELPDDLGDFRPLEKLGAGGMGVVFRAQQRSLGREVALKLVRPEYVLFPGARERFRREAEAVARLAHPNIVPVFSVGEARGAPYFAMELVDGRTLSAILSALAGREAAALEGADLARTLEQSTGKPVARGAHLFGGSWIDAALELARQAAEALEHAHAHGVLHRDVKPSNLMLGVDGRVRLFDFGLTSSAGAERLTRTGQQPGTLLYMSPEQVRGEPVDARADVYSLGVTLYELLTLHAPFAGASSQAIQSRILSGVAPRPREFNARVGRDAQAVCLTAMELDPARRYPSARAFAEDLSRALERRPVLARPPGAPLLAARWVARHPAWSVGAALGLLLVGGVPGALYLQQRALAGEIQGALDQAREAADQERAAREDAETTLNVMTNVLIAATPERTAGKPVTVESIVESAAAAAAYLPDRPSVQGVYLRTLGEVFGRIGNQQRAIEMLERAAEIEVGRGRDGLYRLVLTLNLLGTAEQLAGRTQDARGTFERALQLQAQLEPPNAELLGLLRGNLGGVLYDLRDFDAAEREQRAALGIYLGVEPPDAERIITARTNLAAILSALSRQAEARAETAAAIALMDQAPHLDPVQRATLKNMVGLVTLKCGDAAGAEPVLREAVADLEGLYPGGSPHLAAAVSNLASSLQALGRDEEALEAFDRSLALFEQLGLSEHSGAALARERIDELLRSGDDP